MMEPNNKRDKMLAVMADVNSEVAERAELVECIAITLLTRKNLFILGDTGQAKSYAINEFRKRIAGARQFERLLSKQTDEEALFGRIDLKSLIDGNPKMITMGKIPDSHIVFIDEIFKSNDGVLNSLLTALNERRYTNESEVIDIPVISFMSASNEIPNFNDPAEKILKPLYDRFEIKVITRYIESRDNRLEMLSRKQKNDSCSRTLSSITLDELYAMHDEVANTIIPESINELMDDILCELRRLGIHISDRKYLNYSPIARAKAWLDGRDAVNSTDLLILKNYLWTTPEEIATIVQVLERLCMNPMQEKLTEIEDMAHDSYKEFTESSENKTRAFRKLRGELTRLYDMLSDLGTQAESDSDKGLIETTLNRLEDISRKSHEAGGFTYAPLQELKMLA